MEFTAFDLVLIVILIINGTINYIGMKKHKWMCRWAQWWNLYSILWIVIAEYYARNLMIVLGGK